jgi:hypothetical protein
MRGDTGLDVDDGDGVSDGVVDLTCDPEPFGVDPGAGFLLPSPFRPFSAFLSLGCDEPPGADRLAEGSAHD